MIFLFLAPPPPTSTNKRKYSVLVFVGLVYFTYHDDLQFHPFSSKWQHFLEVSRGTKAGASPWGKGLYWNSVRQRRFSVGLCRWTVDDS
jgi:hypothetical protein